MKRIGALLLSLLFLLNLVPVVYAYVPVSFDGEGSVAKEISSTSEFLEFSERCSRDVYSKDVVFRLTADINLSSADFHGIPYFAGTFLGDGHRILGLNLTGDGSRQGLFRQVAEGAVIKNLSVNGTVAPGGTQHYVGGIAGFNAGKIINCSFHGSVTGLEYVGGIAGFNEATALIDQCSFEGSVSGEHQVGGIVGENAGVISRSENNGKINTEEIVPQSEAHFDLAALSSDDFLDLTDIGGIAGNNTGVISACRNHGGVGYRYTAYNVGGIAGKTSGYLTGCENTAEINGRRDVGGIAGQLIPYMRWEFTNDKLESLSGQLGSLNYLINKASQHVGENTDALGSELSRIKGSAEAANTELEKILRSYDLNVQRIVDSFHIDPDTGTVTVDTINLSGINTTALTSALADITAESSVLSGILRSSFDDLSEDMSKIMRQMSGVMGSMFALLRNQASGELYDTVDLSADETYDHDVGAIDHCVNFGSILAENNAGGVVGSVGFEISFDMEDSLDATRFLTADASQYIFAVIRDSKSHSETQSKNDHVGCVVGDMSTGAVVNCVGTGSAVSLDGDYVGGVAGRSQGCIRDCWSRSVVSGRRYVGGVAGLGQAISLCRSWTHLEHASEYAGAVAGWQENGDVSGNLYVDMSPAGIDGVSFSGMTDPISQEDLLSMPDLPDNFGDLTVRFVAQGETVASLTVPFGGSVETLPTVENDGERYWKWDEFNQEHIYHNMLVEGRYYAPGMTLSSGEEIPMFLVEGVFYEGQSLTVAHYTPDEIEGTLIGAYTLYVDAYEEPLIVHMLNSQNGKLYLVDSKGEVSPASYKEDGKYIVFRMPNGGSFLYVEAAPSARPAVWIVSGLSVAVLSLALILILRRKKKSASETTAGETFTEP